MSAHKKWTRWRHDETSGIKRVKFHYGKEGERVPSKQSLQRKCIGLIGEELTFTLIRTRNDGGHYYTVDLAPLNSACTIYTNIVRCDNLMATSIYGWANGYLLERRGDRHAVPRRLTRWLVRYRRPFFLPFIAGSSPPSRASSTPSQKRMIL